MTEEIKQWIRENLVIDIEYEFGSGAHIKLRIISDDKEFSSAFLQVADDI